MNNYKVIFIIIFILISILFFKKCYFKKKIEKLNYSEVTKNNIILFETEWCEYSRKFKKIWNELKQKLNNKDLFFVEYDCDKYNEICKKNSKICIF